MAYVLHFCKNRECNNGWLDVDKTKCKTRPPQWKYCRDCCEKLGIDFDKQTTPSLTDKQKEVIKENLNNKNE